MVVFGTLPCLLGIQVEGGHVLGRHIVQVEGVRAAGDRVRFLATTKTLDVLFVVSFYLFFLIKIL